ncbi:thiamine diphosphokinase [Desulfonispora thiosulfatigenes DSM 11270]|uniref:Thiamine diphosphokinase n=1 Tax=Desulfonispora thiosulfatigenes DSM 11270 TaxID=656914 RepID=A0A1W1VBN6_DESTI|nr:thiamine diphosphokinase [Desulfonispora thiosulfatigenes]SMB90706.1 thiamine diphosphokinase [Desulfonispora thiosulfatigenes DSM 11270]
MKTVIITNGDMNNLDYYKEIIQNQEYIICVDGAIRYLLKMNINPDIIIGDLDSTDLEFLEVIKAKNIPIAKYPSEKDETDTELAIMLALEKKSSEIILLGGVGSRIDHSFTNFTLMAKTAEKGIKCRIINEKNDCYFVKDYISFKNIDKGYNVSIIPVIGDIIVKETEGLYYPLKNEVLSLGSSRGISNVALKENIAITIKEGMAMIILAKD